LALLKEETQTIAGTGALIKQLSDVVFNHHDDAII